MKIRGWVYIIVNQAIKDLIKIGYSSKDPTLRASDFAQTGVPHKYRVVYDALVDDPYKVEQLVHSNLKRFNEDKEWFNCSVQQGIESIRKNSIKILNFFNNRQEVAWCLFDHDSNCAFGSWFSFGEML